MRYDLRWYTKRFTTAVCALACSILVSTGCGSDLPTDPVSSDPATLLGRLQLNYKAIVLSVHAPYDTVRLDAVARNLRGDSLAHAGTLTFRRQNPLDNSVSVDSAGLVRARASTGAAVTRVIVSLVLNGVEREDTAAIMVRGESSVRKVARLQFSPPATDSARRWADAAPPTITVLTNNWIRLHDAQNQVIPNASATIAFFTSNPDVFALGSKPAYVSTNGTRDIGEAWLRAEVYAYDAVFTDSVLFRRIEPTIKFVLVTRIFPVGGPPAVVFSPSQLEIKPGMTVVFMNRLGTSDPEVVTGGLGNNLNRILRTTSFGDYVHEWVDSTGITFEAQPGPVLAGDSYGRVGVGVFNAAAGYPSDGGTGDIPRFSWVRCVRVNAANTTTCGGNVTVTTQTLDTGLRSRKFTTPGTYRYTSTAFPEASGTIVVTASP